MPQRNSETGALADRIPRLEAGAGWSWAKIAWESGECNPGKRLGPTPGWACLWTGSIPGTAQ